MQSGQKKISGSRSVLHCHVYVLKLFMRMYVDINVAVSSISAPHYGT